MSAPNWMESVISEFGRAAGVGELALNGRGAAALSFDSGAKLRLEYAEETLVVAMTVPWHGDSATLKRLLSYAHPQSGIRVRCGLSARSGALLAAIRLPERDVTLPNLNMAFSSLWRIAEDLGGVQ